MRADLRADGPNALTQALQRATDTFAPVHVTLIADLSAPILTYRATLFQETADSRTGRIDRHAGFFPPCDAPRPRE
jgi:hypothetical protein